MSEGVGFIHGSSAIDVLIADLVQADAGKIENAMLVENYTERDVIGYKQLEESMNDGQNRHLILSGIYGQPYRSVKGVHLKHLHSPIRHRPSTACRCIVHSDIATDHQDTSTTDDIPQDLRLLPNPDSRTCRNRTEKRCDALLASHFCWSMSTIARDIDEEVNIHPSIDGYNAYL